IQKAKARAEATTPYAKAITRAVSAVATHSNIDHPLLTEPATVTPPAILVFTSDRGLAGAFNAQVLREAEELSELLRSEGKAVSYCLVGRKAQGYFAFRQRAAERVWTGFTENPQFENGREITEALLEAFTMDTAAGGVDEIHLVYNRL